MSELLETELLETIAKLEQKLTNRNLLLERIIIWLRQRPGSDPEKFLTQIEKHLKMLQEVEGDQEEEARTLGQGKR